MVVSGRLYPEGQVEDLNRLLQGLLQMFEGAAGFILSEHQGDPRIRAACGVTEASRASEWAHELLGVVRATFCMHEPLMVRHVAEMPTSILEHWPSTLQGFRSVWAFPVGMERTQATLVMLHPDDKVATRSEWQHCIWYASHMKAFLEHYHPSPPSDIESMMPFIQQLEQKDPYTAGHSLKVASYAAQLALAVGLPTTEVRFIYAGGLLHDIGKVDIPSEILLKPTGLTAEEFAEVKKHPVHGEKYLGLRQDLAAYRPFVRHHHERLDGLGYPDGLMRNEIPMYVRILTIADAFDAMTSHRVYRRSLTKGEAIRQLREHSETQFDGTLVRVFERCMRYNPYARIVAEGKGPVTGVPLLRGDRTRGMDGWSS